jgi:glycosyltransferase involved in cell wall biosynthesis
MNIVFFSRFFYPHIGGVEKHVLEVSKELIKKGHNVSVITENRSTEDIPVYLQSIKIYRIRVEKDDWFKKFRIWKELWKIRYLINAADIVHCHDVFFWYLPFRFLYFKKPVFTTFHGYETKFPISKKAIFIRKINEMLSFGDICIGDYIKKWYGTKPDYVMYGGVNKAKSIELKTKSLRSKMKIVFVGRLSKDMGINVYSQALKKLKKKKFSFEFRAYGEGELGKSLSKIGKVYPPVLDISDVMQKTDVVFASSYLTILEALSLSKIVIAVYENQLKEDYLKTSPFSNFILIAKDSDEVYKIVKNIKENSWKYKSMVNNGYEWVRKNTWENCADIYLKLWKK